MSNNRISAQQLFSLEPSGADVLAGFHLLGLDDELGKPGEHTAVFPLAHGESIILQVLPGHFTAQEVLKLFHDAGIAA